MAKKKKKSQKSKKKKGKKKTDISHLEKETFKITIQNLKMKIEEKKDMIEDIEDEICVYEEVNSNEIEDEIECLKLLKQTISEQNGIIESLKIITSDCREILAENEDEYSVQIADEHNKINEENSANESDLQRIAIVLQDLESYDFSKTEEQITDIKGKLEIVDEKDEMSSELMNEVLIAQISSHFKDLAELYQEGLKSKVSERVLEYADQTKWWKESADLLVSMNEAKNEDNKIEAENLRKGKDTINFDASSDMALSVDIMKMKEKLETFEELQKEQELKMSMGKKIEKLIVQRNDSTKWLERQIDENKKLDIVLKDKEDTINDQEKQLDREVAIEKYLRETVLKSKHLIEEELLETEKGDLQLKLIILFRQAMEHAEE